MSSKKCLTALVHVHAISLGHFTEEDYARAIRTQIEHLVGFKVKHIDVIDLEERATKLIDFLESKGIPIGVGIDQPSFEAFVSSLIDGDARLN